MCLPFRQLIDLHHLCSLSGEKLVVLARKTCLLPLLWSHSLICSRRQPGVTSSARAVLLHTVPDLQAEGVDPFLFVPFSSLIGPSD